LAHSFICFILKSVVEMLEVRSNNFSHKFRHTFALANVEKFHRSMR
jgi:hypothetical protein